MTKPPMERRHFELIAKTIADYGYPLDQRRLAPHFARVLAHTNPNFNRARFLEACGVKED